MNDRLCKALIGLVVCWFGGWPFGSTALCTEPEIRFRPPPAVTVRTTSGQTARGRLLGINADHARVRILNGEEIEFELDRVRFIRASSRRSPGRRQPRSFEFRPASEAFEMLTRRVRAIPDATLVQDGGQVAAGAAPTRIMTHNTLAGGDHAADRDRGSLRRQETTQSTQANPAGQHPGPAGRIKASQLTPNTSDDESDDLPSAIVIDRIGILKCLNCNHELPATIGHGRPCPQCGQLMEFAIEATGHTMAVPNHPFAASDDAPKTQRLSRAAVDTVELQASAAVEKPDLSLSSMPLIAKIGIFGGFIALGWLIIQRR